MSLTPQFYQMKRQELFAKMVNDSVLILLSNDSYPKNGDQNFSFRQQSDLFYLTGIKQEETTLVLSKDANGSVEEMLFLLEPNPKMETWEGKKLTQLEASNISGVDTIAWEIKAKPSIHKLIEKNTLVYLLGEDAFSKASDLNLIHSRFYQEIEKQFPKNNIAKARPLLTELRLIKTKAEIEMMQEAVDLTNRAFEQVLKSTKVGMNEYEVEAEISYIFRKNGAESHAYQPIIATGVNACSLHYIKNDSGLRDGDLLLMDFGADNQYYAADLSRTIPVNGTFTKRQKQLYQIVLDVQKKSIELFVPGNTIDLVNEKTNSWMGEALREIGMIESDEEISKYFPHGTSHFLGLDVHDVGLKTTVFQEGMVLTCEPGLYIEEESIGIRIENDIVVAVQPIDLMHSTIREIDEIEKAMRRN